MVSGPSITQSNLLTTLRSFLLTILPANAATWSGTITGTTMTVTNVIRGTIAVNASVFGLGVAPGTKITGFGTGTGGIGTYQVGVSQTLTNPITMSDGVEVVKGQINRVPEPASPDFIVMTPAYRRRLGTNIDSPSDVAFTGHISGNTLTVTAVMAGTIAVNDLLFGATIAPGTMITAFGTGTGGTGTYSISIAQIAASQTIQAGSTISTQATEARVQIDVHGPNSEDNAQVVTTLMRSSYAVSFFTASGFDMAPLHADDARQMPFVNGEQQIEYRWVIDAFFQINPAVATPIQFADALDITLTNVDASFPPS